MFAQEIVIIFFHNKTYVLLDYNFIVKEIIKHYHLSNLNTLHSYRIDHSRRQGRSRDQAWTRAEIISKHKIAKPRVYSINIFK